MKIAVIGAQSTGKTTVAEVLYAYLAGRGHNVKLISELARKCPFPVNEDTTLEAQQWILMQQIKEERLHEKEADFIITDRSVLDNYMYLYKHLGKHHDELHSIMLEHLATYDYLLFTTVNSDEIICDGFRSTDVKFRDIMDELIKHKLDNLSSYLEKNNVTVLAVDLKSVHSIIDELVSE
jgi:nicotinamide riboside kinase